MSDKIRVGVLCGGVSCEHEVSLVSAQNVMRALDPEKYETSLIFIDKKGHWHQVAPRDLLDHDSHKLLSGTCELTAPVSTKAPVTLPEGRLDVIFPVLHGPYGEDGTVQGFLKLARVPFVGADVCGSAVGMDKDIQKRILRDAGIPVVKFRTLYSAHRDKLDPEMLIEQLGLPLFVKPANLGSSVAISKAKTKDELIAAIDNAFEYDKKVLVEEFCPGREIECAVLGNESPIASVPGEVITSYEFYDFEAKYLDDKLKLEIPASLTASQVRQVQELSICAFELLSCAGMARVDFFLRDDGKLLVNEINTIPGFTNSSMYPKLWDASGIGYVELVDRLIELALERHNRESLLKTSN
ncbi:MAG: D-alanine--D-alanine ligase [Verrucomicrobia bacterium]|nr:D-alanine--D-alanine ligase [Verrucomicrobiota bacterium]MBS0637049.1 D-alanine--D-alanine ligase [Verrucomicrobiota bacterium]